MFEYELTILSIIGIYIILALGQNIMLGYAGQPMMGVIALTGIGAYTSALITVHTSLTFWIALPTSALMGAFIGLLFGWLTIRLREDYLCVASIGLAYVVAAIFTHTPWFGRMYGIIDIPRPSIFGFILSEIWQFSILTCIVAAILIFLDVKLSRSWLGLALRSIRDDEAAAESLGVNAVRIKVLAFVVGATFAGAAGSLFAHFLRNIHPEYFEFGHSVDIFLMPILGGMGTTIGAVLGALIMVVVPEVLRGVAEYRTLFYGLLLIILPIYQPMGLFGPGSFLRRKIIALYEYAVKRISS